MGLLQPCFFGSNSATSVFKLKSDSQTLPRVRLGASLAMSAGPLILQLAIFSYLHPYRVPDCIFRPKFYLLTDPWLVYVNETVSSALDAFSVDLR
jgi:hypothetical protein